MKRIICMLLLSKISLSAFAQQPCAPIVPPQFSESAKKNLDEKLAVAKNEFEKNPESADALIWYGRRTAYLGNYLQAIEIFSKGIALYPTDARFLRHRGHRYITTRCFDEAIVDFKKAAKLEKGKLDEVEPDGMPNEKNIPTSTLQSNIYYHLGLAYYLKADYKNALKAYEECLKVSTNNDMYVATFNWLYLTMRKMENKIAAEKRLAKMNFEMELIENEDYLEILKIHKKKSEMKLQTQETLSSSTLGFALGSFYLLNGFSQKAKEVFEKVISGNQWASFGFIAAEAELKRMQ